MLVFSYAGFDFYAEDGLANPLKPALIRIGTVIIEPGLGAHSLACSLQVAWNSYFCRPINAKFRLCAHFDLAKDLANYVAHHFSFGVVAEVWSQVLDVVYLGGMTSVFIASYDDFIQELGSPFVQRNVDVFHDSTFESRRILPHLPEDFHRLVHNIDDLLLALVKPVPVFFRSDFLAPDLFLLAGKSVLQNNYEARVVFRYLCFVFSVVHEV